MACIQQAVDSDEELAALQVHIHAFLRECWEALDGLAREVNVCMGVLFPDAPLYPPDRMTRQCGFYMVRKTLHEESSTAAHPVSELLWEETRGRPAGPYRRLSYLYNLSLFLPVPLLRGACLPGTADLPDFALSLLKPQQVGACSLVSGTEEICEWLTGFCGRCHAMLSAALKEASKTGE